MVKIRLAPGIENLQGFPLEKSLEEIQLESGSDDLIPQAWLENGWGPSPKVIRALRNELLMVNRYPDNSFHLLKNGIAKRHGVDPGEVVIGSDCGHLVELLVKCFVREGEEVICSDPSRSVFQHAIAVHGCKSVHVPLHGMEHDLAQIKQAISPSTRLVLLDNPSCVTGCALSPVAIYQFLSEVPENVPVVFDETLIDYVQESFLIDLYSLIRNTEKRCAPIFLRSFSTLYGLAGLRIGYGIMDRSIAEILDRVRAPYSVNRMAIAGALAVLEDEQYYQEIVEKTLSERFQLEEKIKRTGCRVISGEGNFLMIDIGMDGDLLSSNLLQKGCLVRSMKKFGFPGHIRVTIGTEEENNRFLECFEQCRSEL